VNIFYHYVGRRCEGGQAYNRLVQFYNEGRVKDIIEVNDKDSIKISFLNNQVDSIVRFFDNYSRSIPMDSIHEILSYEDYVSITRNSKIERILK